MILSGEIRNCGDAVPTFSAAFESAGNSLEKSVTSRAWLSRNLLKIYEKASTLLMASSGRATSISFFRYAMMLRVLIVFCIATRIDLFISIAVNWDD